MSRSGIKPGPPPWEASTLAKSYSKSVLIAIRNIYIWARDQWRVLATIVSLQAATFGMENAQKCHDQEDNIGREKTILTKSLWLYMDAPSEDCRFSLPSLPLTWVDMAAISVILTTVQRCVHRQSSQTDQKPIRQPPPYCHTTPLPSPSLTKQSSDTVANGDIWTDMQRRIHRHQSYPNQRPLRLPTPNLHTLSLKGNSLLFCQADRSN